MHKRFRWLSLTAIIAFEITSILQAEFKKLSTFANVVKSYRILFMNTGKCLVQHSHKKASTWSCQWNTGGRIKWRQIQCHSYWQTSCYIYAVRSECLTVESCANKFIYGSSKLFGEIITSKCNTKMLENSYRNYYFFFKIPGNKIHEKDTQKIRNINSSIYKHNNIRNF